MVSGEQKMQVVPTIGLVATASLGFWLFSLVVFDYIGMDKAWGDLFIPSLNGTVGWMYRYLLN